MTLSELINQLTSLAENLNPSGDLFTECDPTVMIAYQQSWPLQVAASSVVVALDPVKVFVDEYGPAPVDGDPAWQDAYDDAQAADKTVYIAEGSGSTGYLDTSAAKLLGWS